MIEPLRKCRVCGLEAWTEEDLKNFVEGKMYKYGHENVCLNCKSPLNIEYKNRIKTKAFKKLSIDGIPKCAVCGFSDDIRFLQIDHIKNDGYKDLTSWGGRYKASSVCRKILKMPKKEAIKKYQVLCAFHNWAKRFGKIGEEYKVIVLRDSQDDS